jgi:hypothetical protein
MTTVVMQIIMIDDMIKVEFKITDHSGYSRLIEKTIETEADFEKFRNEVNTEIKSLEPVVKITLQKKDNGKAQPTAGDNEPPANLAGKIQPIGV